MEEEIQLEQYDHREQPNGSDIPHPTGGILCRAKTDVHMTERPQQYRDPGKHTVIWSSTLPSYNRQTSEGAGEDDLSFYPPSHGGQGVGAPMGDWQHTLGVRRRRGLIPIPDSVDGADALVKEYTRAMQEDHKFMADDADGEVKRRNAFRELTEPLAARKEIRRRLTASSRKRGKKLSCWRGFCYQIDMSVLRSKESLRAAVHDYSLWHSDLKVIEGIFGGGVATYFRFLRYLLLLNVTISLLLVGMVLTPQLLGEHLGFFSIAANGSVAYGPEPPNDTATFGPVDWLTGDGWLLQSELFYGAYSNLWVCHNNSCSTHYNISLAYISTVLVCFLMYLIAIARRVIQLYKEHTLSGGGSMLGSFVVANVFTAWDFGITDEKAAKVKHSSICNELRALSSELDVCDVDVSGWEAAKRVGVKAAVWLGFAVLTGLLGWFIYVLLDNFLEKLNSQDITDYWPRAGALLVFPIVVTALLLVLPFCLELLTQLERYSSKRLEVLVTLTRTTVLELLVLGVLLGFWFEGSSTTGSSSNPSAVEPSPYNTTCWESSLGAELYRLTVMDFLVQVLGSCCIMIGSLACPSTRLFAVFSEFSVARNTLHLVYNQTLVWAALFFSPLMPLVSVVKLALLFYLQKVQVVRSQRPPARPWRSAQTETIFFALVLVSLVVAALATGFVLVRGCSSSSCGPLAGMCPYVSVLYGLSEGDRGIVYSVLLWVTKPGVVAAVIVCLIIGVYWARSLARGRGELVAVLRYQLELEAKDRAFLLSLASKLNSGKKCTGLGGLDLHQPLQSPSSHASSPPTAHGITRGSFTFSREATPERATQREVGDVGSMPPVDVTSDPTMFYTPEAQQFTS